MHSKATVSEENLKVMIYARVKIHVPKRTEKTLSLYHKLILVTEAPITIKTNKQKLTKEEANLGEEGESGFQSYHVI